MKTFSVEFPDFDPATLPKLPQGFQDDSWHNDACPSFHNAQLRLSIFIDYAAPEMRAFADGVRFHIFRTDEDGGRLPANDASFTSDDWSEIQTYVLAEQFARHLKASLSEKDWKEMRRRNASPDYDNSLSCASHDFCDANMVMEATWRATFGEKAALICEGANGQIVAEQMAIWNAAWSRAKSEQLTAKPEAPFFHKLMPLSTGHLCAETREWLSDRPADGWPILGGVTEYGYFVHCPEEIQELPADLWACILFATSKGAEYILFDQVEDILPDLIDFSEQDNESAAGMADAEIDDDPINISVVLPGGKRLTFPKARNAAAAAIEAELFREAWRDLVGRDRTGASRSSTIETLAKKTTPKRTLSHETGSPA
ncbi:hypothetical protein SAMN06265338_12616 [Rhodoblastus acidophilus]|uniref:DUF5983 domain-containing protein n=1 Tax=Rhodoblastus acidophilus TaxID=1074 RepID=A0A212SD21_RHOAC|nr:hypothetical protein [Rhodoblastus acidophilus]PPQ35581.1 hypothetical protein CKO16_20270 [Rhodoblastus acidophilus]RAI16994.1 hypothetical protein CH337_18460 [Rhodoblastus acidophilus]SNB83373.1 hypothetical protein SAMN06265338_12616 [Rhodoblastus acidophilus]